MAVLGKECELQREAFDIFYDMGADRNIEAVAEKVDRAVRTVAGWSRTYNWADRVKQRDAESGYSLDIITKYRVMISKLYQKAVEDIESGKLKIKTVEDLEIVIKLDLLLMGEPVDRTEVTTSNTVSLPKELRELLDAKIEELKKENSQEL